MRIKITARQRTKNFAHSPCVVAIVTRSQGFRKSMGLYFNFNKYWSLATLVPLGIALHIVVFIVVVVVVRVHVELLM